MQCEHTLARQRAARGYVRLVLGCRAVVTVGRNR